MVTRMIGSAVAGLLPMAATMVLVVLAASVLEMRRLVRRVSGTQVVRAAAVPSPPR